MKEFKVESEENLLSSIFSPKELSWFNLEEEACSAEVTGAEEDDFFHLEIFLSPDRFMYKRSIYTFLDLLGDVGGLLDALRFIGFYFMFFYTLIRGDLLSEFLISSVFQKEIKSSNIQPSILKI